MKTQLRDTAKRIQHTRLVRRVRVATRPLRRFWQKLDEDWIFNLSGMLAYNYLVTTTPIVLLLLAIAGIALGAIAPATFDTFVAGLASRVPAGQGEELIQGALTALRESAGLLLALSVITALIAGSRLFITLESCFAVIFRGATRPLIPQNVMAVLMTLLYTILAPLAFLASAIFSSIANIILPNGSRTVSVESLVIGVAVAFLLFAAMYLFTPNRRPSWHASWRGALVAAVLVNLYELLFPLYRQLFLRNAGYGSVIGLAIVALIFFYYIGFITLLGAEINAWVIGMRPFGRTLPQLFLDRNRQFTSEQAEQAEQAPAQPERRNAPPPRKTTDLSPRPS